MDIKDLNKAEVLAELYNHAKPQGMGFLHYDPNPMTVDEAQQILDQGHTYFDYVKGRVMKVDLGTDELNTRLYNRDNGENAAESVIERLVKSHESQ